MPTRTLKIIDGPSFRKFVMESGVFPETPWDSTFRMDQENLRKPGSFHFTMTIKAIGKVDPRPGFTRSDSDLFWFIGRSTWIHVQTKEQERLLKQLTPVIYIGTYSVRTRTGECQEVPKEEFFAQNPHMAAVIIP